MTGPNSQSFRRSQIAAVTINSKFSNKQIALALATSLSWRRADAKTSDALEGDRAMDVVL
jgi:hypothetical protein